MPIAGPRSGAAAGGVTVVSSCVGIGYLLLECIYTQGADGSPARPSAPCRSADEAAADDLARPDSSTARDPLRTGARMDRRSRPCTCSTGDQETQGVAFLGCRALARFSASSICAGDMALAIASRSVREFSPSGSSPNPAIAELSHRY